VREFGVTRNDEGEHDLDVCRDDHDRADRIDPACERRRCHAS
jgi:hypothetical protein